MKNENGDQVKVQQTSGKNQKHFSLRRKRTKEQKNYACIFFKY